MCQITLKISFKWALALFFISVTGQLNAQSSSQSVPNIHIVKEGQNLYRIAINNGLTLQQIIEMNNLKNNRIFPGQRLVVGLSNPGSGESNYNKVEYDSENYESPDYNYVKNDIHDDYYQSENFPREESSDENNVYIGDINGVNRERPQGNLYSLSVGNPKKDYPSYGNSSALVSDDIQMLSHILSGQEGKTFKKVEIFPFDDVDHALDQISDKIQQIKSHAQSEDMLMINVYGTTQSPSQELGIVPSGDRNRSASSNDAMTLDYIFNSVGNIPCKKILICDANFTRNELDQYLFEHQIDHHEVAFIASHWHKAVYSQRGEWNHGAIFKAMREALSGKADLDHNGEVTLTEVDIYLNDRVMELTGNVQYAQLIVNQLRNPDPVLAYLN